MYCPGCGAQLQEGLIFCSRCGRRSADDLTTSAWSNPMAPTAVVACVGFFSFMLVARTLTRSSMPPGLFVPISFFYFAALFSICFAMLRHGSRSTSAPRSQRTFDTGELSRPAYISPISTSQLEEARTDIGFGSVTDATTRTLDEASVKRRAVDQDTP